MDERSGMDVTIDRARRGDRAALGELVAEHYARVFRFCARRVGDDLGQDAAQETFITMQRTIGGFEGRSAFETWLLGGSAVAAGLSTASASTRRNVTSAAKR